MGTIRLEVKIRGETARTLVVDSFPCVVGRDPAAGLTLADERASRRHARIDCEAGRPVLVDLGASNGTWLARDGDEARRVERVVLAPGTRVKIGESWLECLELSGFPEDLGADRGEPLEEGPLEDEGDAGAGGSIEPDGAAEEEPDAPDDGERRQRALATHRRRRFATVAGPLVLLLAIAGIVAWWFDTREQEKREAAKVAAIVPPEIAAARMDRAIFEARLARSPRITTELLGELEALRIRHLYTELPGEERTFAELGAYLQSVQNLETENRFGELRRRRAQLVRDGQYAEAIAYVRGEAAAISSDDGRAVERSKEFVRTTDEAIAERAEARLRGLPRLDEFADDETATREWRDALERFRGTPHAGTIELAYREQLEARLVAERARLAELRATRTRDRARRAARERERDEIEDRAPAGLGLSLLRIVERSIGTCLSGEMLSFGGFEGHVRGLVRREVLVQTTGGEQRIAADEIPAATLLAIATRCLPEGEQLLAAEIGYRHGLQKEADGFALAYLRSTGERKGLADDALGALLADLRGLPRVPEGSFTYSSRHGWESRVEIVRREAVDEAGKLARALRGARLASKLEEKLLPITSLLESPELDEPTRDAIRDLAAKPMIALHDEVLARLRKRIEQTGFARLRAARAELDRRRKEALAVIYDAEIYLPEDHPDWGRGDVTNGQRKVDEAVDRVRELWEGVGSFVVEVDARTLADTKLLAAIEKTHLPALARSIARADEETLDDLLRNIEQRVDLRTFARDAADRQVHAQNRLIEDYNLRLESPDVSESDKAHVAELNGYREMMGERRLAIDARLCRATRKHSEACDRAGRIWHNGPDGSPGSRAKAEGYSGGVGENVAMGYANPKDIWWRGWYRASDHHRNALGSRWRCIGYGYAGQVGTQNFGSEQPALSAD